MTAAERLADLLHMGSTLGVVVHDPSNMFYLTEGYTGEGLVYISSQRQVIITDSRYTEQAGRQAPGFAVVEISNNKNHNEWLAEMVHQDGVTELRVETNYLPVDPFERLKDAVGEEVSCVPLQKAPQKLREVKSPSEVVTMRKAADITT